MRVRPDRKQCKWAKNNVNLRENNVHLLYQNVRRPKSNVNFPKKYYPFKKKSDLKFLHFSVDVKLYHPTPAMSEK